MSLYVKHEKGQLLPMYFIQQMQQSYEKNNSIDTWHVKHKPLKKYMLPPK
jgi:hypothetical protein